MINKDLSSECSSQTSQSKSKTVPPKSAQKSLRELIAEGRNRASRKPIKSTGEIEVMDPYVAVNNYKNYEDKKTAYIEELGTSHYCLWDSNYPENPERTACAKRRLEALDLIRRCEVIKPEVYSEDLYIQKHTKNLYERLKSSSRLSEAELREESSKWDSIYFNQDTFEIAKKTADAAMTMVLRVAKGDFKNGFALIRPPGHHAMADAFCGYCFINNVAVAAETVIAQGYAKKVLIVDYDVHHGQGTQQMFYNRNDVLYFSIHRFEHGEFWPNLRESDSDYIGEGPGKGYNVNVPLNKIGMGDSDYLAIVLNLLLPLAYEFKPDIILISAGYDAAIGCPEGQMKVTPHFYGHLITLLSGLANGKIAVCLEGGYFRESLAEGAACTLKALLGDACYPLNIQSNPTVDPALQECETFFEYPKPGEEKIGWILDENDEHVTRIDFKHAALNTGVFETADCYPVQSDKEIEDFLATIKRLREEYLKSRKYENIIGYVYDDELLKHKPTGDSGKTPPEKPERLTEIMKCLVEFGLIGRCEKVNQSQFDIASWLEQTHCPKYVKRILTQRDICEKPDWYFNDDTSGCIIKCVSLILSLAQSISKGSVRAGVAIIRPPGHHATRDRGSGFCFVNNVVVAAEFLVQKESFKRVLIVDFDIHHGNGTQQLTYKRSDVMYISVHRFDRNKFFPSQADANYAYKGEGEGEGYNVNIPFNKGSKSDVDYWTVWYKLVLPLAYSYNPDFVIISAGFDAGVFDPLGGGYKISPEMFGQMVHTLKSLASGRVLLALEGGYHVETTALSMTACVKALLGDPLPVPNFSDKVSEDTVVTIRNVVVTHRDRWPLLKVNKKLANFSYTQKIKLKLQELNKIASKNPYAAKEIQNVITECRRSTSNI